MKKAIIICIAVCLASVSWFAIAREFRFSGPEKSNALDGAELTIVTDNSAAPEASDTEKKILAELLEIFAAPGSGNTFYMQGTLEVYVPADSSSQGSAKAAFSYYKNGEELWFKNPEQEIVNNNTHYIVVDHALKRIVVAPARSVEKADVLPLSSIGKNLKSEDYTIGKTVQNGKAVITLLSQHHISCKEIRIEYDDATKSPSLLFYRFSDPDHPDEEGYDKTMSISLTKWETGEGVKQRIPLPVAVSEKKISGVDQYKEYDIIDLFTK